MTKEVLVSIPPSLFGNQGPRDLVYGCWCAGKRVGGILMPPVSSVQIATVLNHNNIATDFFDYSFLSSLKKLPDNISSYKIVVMLSSSVSFSEDKLFLEYLKKQNSKIFTIVWGSGATFLPQDSVSNNCVDVAVIGEGEQTILEVVSEFLKGGNWHRVKGISYQKQGKPFVNEPQSLIEDLDKLPFPDRTLLDENKSYYNPAVLKYPYTTMYTTRGCFGKCVFCTSPEFYGNRIRQRSAQNVTDEIKYAISLGYKEIFFRDENFTSDRKRLIDICEKILQENIDIKWICSSRVDCLDEEMISLMKQSGCHMVRLGIESGNDAILEKSGKNIKTADSVRVVGMLKQYKIDIHAHMLLGLPSETKETAQQTIDFAISLNPEIATFGICTPFPGTKLWEMVSAKINKKIDADSCNLNMLHKKAFYNKYFCDLDETTLEKLVRLAYRRFYMRFGFVKIYVKNNFSVIGIKKLFISGFRVLLFMLGK